MKVKWSILLSIVLVLSMINPFFEQGLNHVLAASQVVNIPVNANDLKPMYELGTVGITGVYKDVEEFNSLVTSKEKVVDFFSSKDRAKAEAYFMKYYKSIFPNPSELIDDSAINFLNFDTYFKTGWMVWGNPNGKETQKQHLNIGYDINGNTVTNIQHPETVINPATTKWLDWTLDSNREDIMLYMSSGQPYPIEKPKWHDPRKVYGHFLGLAVYNDGFIDEAETEKNANALIDLWFRNIENRYDGSKSMLIDLPNLNSLDKMKKHFQIMTPPTDVSYGLARGWFKSGSKYHWRTFRIAPVTPYDLYFIKKDSQGIYTKDEGTSNASFNVVVKNGGVYPVERTSFSLIYETTATNQVPVFSENQFEEMAKKAFSHPESGGWDGNPPKEIKSGDYYYKVYYSKERAKIDSRFTKETFAYTKLPSGNYRFIHRINERKVDLAYGTTKNISFDVSGYHNKDIPYKAFADVNVYISHVPEKSFKAIDSETVESLGNMADRDGSVDFEAESVEYRYNNTKKAYDLYLNVKYQADEEFKKYNAADPTTKKVNFRTTYTMKGASTPTGSLSAQDGEGWLPNSSRKIHLGTLTVPTSATSVTITAEINHDRSIVETNYANNIKSGDLTFDGGTFKGSILHFPKLKDGMYSTYVVYAYTRWPEGKGDTITRRIKGYRFTDTLTHDFVYDLKARSKILVFDQEVTFTKDKPFYARKITFSEPTKDKEQKGFLVIIDDMEETSREVVVGVNSATSQQWKAGISWSSIDPRLDDLPWAKIKAEYGIDRAAWNLGKHNIRDEKTRADKPSIVK